jgi:formylglycine-generating enzyme required for sulfatase activity
MRVAQAYSAGGANKSQMRTHILSNGEILWDLAGNVWEWNDMQCDTTAWYSGAAWSEWSSANLTDSEKYMAGPNGSLTSANGAGQYCGCTVSGNALLRGGGWGASTYDGEFSIRLDNAPSVTGASIGFRCALQP